LTKRPQWRSRASAGGHPRPPKKLLTEKHPSTASAIGRACTQITIFVKVIAAGAYVRACDGGTVLGVGRLTGDYTFDAASDFPHRRPAEWLSLEAWKMPEPEGLLATVHQVKQHPANLLEAERRVQKAPGAPPIPPIPCPSAATSHPESGHRPWPAYRAGSSRSSTARARSFILYGPPGARPASLEA
jgi:5-methylcytosine-specific restriction protein B